MSQPFFDLTGAFSAQQNHLNDLKNRNLNDTNVATNLTTMSSNLDNTYNNIQTASGNSASILTNQTNMLNIVNTELDRLTTKKQKVDTALVGQNRMIQLNDSYRQKTAYYIYVMIIFIIILIIYIFFNILRQKLNYIPDFIFDIINLLLGVITFFVFYYAFANIISKDNMDFSELKFAPPNMPLSKDEIKQQQQNALNSGDLLGSINVIGCIGDQCCSDGTEWDSGNSVCIRSGFTTMLNSGEIFANHAVEGEDYAFIN